MTPEQQAAKDALDAAKVEQQAAADAFDATTVVIKEKLIQLAPYQEELQNAENKHHETRQRLTNATVNTAQKQAAFDALNPA